MVPFALPLAGLLPDFMTPEGTTLLFSIVIFFAMLAILWKFAFGPIMHALEEREKGIQKTIDDADKKFKDAESRAAEYEKKILGAKDEAAKLLAEAKREVDVLTAEEKAKVRVEIDAEKERAKREIALAKDAAVAEVRERVIQLTAQIAAKVVHREIKPQDHTDLLAAAFDEIGKRN